MNIALKQFAQLMHGRLINDVSVTVNGISIDTRTLQAGQAYFAIQGQRFDGHHFISEAAGQGASVIVAHCLVNTHLPLILVDDTRLALGRFASAWRQMHSNLLVVGLTGSNGKTTTKEMLASILTVHHDVLYTQGNLNNDIGVPLTLCRLNDQYRYAVIEMGANHPGEIAYTSEMVKPNVSIITNAGAAHLEGFLSLDGVANAKGEIIDSVPPQGIVILNHEDAYFNAWQLRAAPRQVMSFGLHALADVWADRIEQQLIAQALHTTFMLHTPQGEVFIELPLAGQHNILNALAASAACLSLGITLDVIQQGLSVMQTVSGRLQTLLAENGTTVINDCYNANMNSFRAALDVLACYNTERWVVLGAFGELGGDSETIHHGLADLMKQYGVNRVFAIGEPTQLTTKQFGKGALFFENQTQLIESLKNQLTGKETLLIKGSRAQHLENVTASLIKNFRMY